MSNKCRAFSKSKLGLEPFDNRQAFYAGWDAAQMSELEAKNAALREDAGRYRWLRDECHDTPIGVYEWTGMDGAQGRVFLSSEELDAAIDAARKE